MGTPAVSAPRKYCQNGGSCIQLLDGSSEKAPFERNVGGYKQACQKPREEKDIGSQGDSVQRY